MGHVWDMFITMLLGTKCVVMAHHGLILWENEATGSRRFLDASGSSGTLFVSKQLPTPYYAIKSTVGT